MSATQDLLRFGVFELNVTTEELRKSGILIRLAPQPLKLLALLARRSGQVVTRVEIQQTLWGEETYVDFEQGIGYQGLVAEFWYSSVLLCDRNDVPVPALVRQRLGRMFEFMLAYTRPDGTFPQIGDNMTWLMTCVSQYCSVVGSELPGWPL